MLRTPLTVLLLATVSCVWGGRQSRDDAPSPGQEPATLVEARTASCLTRIGVPGDGHATHRARFEDGSCTCDTTYCGGTPHEADDGTWDGQPLKGTGWGEGHYVCSSVTTASPVIDARGCPIQQPADRDACPADAMHLGLECAYLRDPAIERMRCRGGVWVTLPEGCDPNVP